MKEAIERFLHYLTVEKGFSQNTVVAYSNDLNQLANFAREEAARRGTFPSWDSYNRQVFLSYLLDLKERGYVATTQARKLAAAKSFFKFMVEEGDLKVAPTLGVDSPRLGKSLPKPIPVSWVFRLLEEPAKHASLEAKRDKAMLELLYASGMRVSELISLNLDDVDVEGGSVRCFGKGRKERLIPIAPRAAASVTEYVKGVRPRLAHNNNEKALFLNPRG